jgi:hypothetical protein
MMKVACLIILLVKIPLLYFFDKDLNENINITISSRYSFLYLYQFSNLEQYIT